MSETKYLYDPLNGAYSSEENLVLTSGGFFIHTYKTVNIDYGYNFCSGEETFETKGTFKIVDDKIYFKFEDGFEWTGKFGKNSVTFKRTSFVEEVTFNKV